MSNPRVPELLAQVRQALALRRRLVDASRETAEVDRALDELYRTLGREVAQEASERDPDWTDGPLVDRDGFALRPSDVPPQLDTDELPVPTAHSPEPGWYTEDEEDEGADSDGDVDAGAPSDAGDGPLFDAEDRGQIEDIELSARRREIDAETGLDPLDDSTPVIPAERFLGGPHAVGLAGPHPDSEYFESEEPSDYVVATVAGYLAQRDGDAHNPFGQLRRGERPTWWYRLDELLAMLALPASFADLQELGVEASRVQWATTDLAPRLVGIPAEVQVGVVALLGARAQHLRHRLDIDVGPRLSIDRLQRYRIDEDLPPVAALQPTPRPERGSWESDARAWFALLRGEP